MNEVQDLRDHIFNGVDLIQHLLRDPSDTAKGWAREWCATEIARAPAPALPRQGPYCSYCQEEVVKPSPTCRVSERHGK